MAPLIRQDDPAAQECALAAGRTLIRRYVLALPRPGQAMRPRSPQPGTAAKRRSGYSWQRSSTCLHHSRQRRLRRAGAIVIAPALRPFADITNRARLEVSTARPCWQLPRFPPNARSRARYLSMRDERDGDPHVHQQVAAGGPGNGPLPANPGATVRQWLADSSDRDAHREAAGHPQLRITAQGRYWLLHGECLLTGRGSG
jgi:hypothetical protein